MNVIKIEGPRRSGKTTALKGLLKTYMDANPDKHVIIAAPNFNMLRDFDLNPSNKVHTINNNSTRGARGVSTDFLVLDETSYLDKEVIYAIIPCLTENATIAYSVTSEKEKTYDELNSMFFSDNVNDEEPPSYEQGKLF